MTLADKSMNMRMMYASEQDQMQNYQGMQQMLGNTDYQDCNRRLIKQKRKNGGEKRGLLTHYLTCLTDQELVQNTLTGFIISELMRLGP